ncbi:MAG: tetratricopeptide repeat protein [Planctomycetota bacterium]
MSHALLAAALSSFLSAQEPATDLGALRKEATAAVQSGDYAIAAAAFKKLTVANPKDGEAWHMLGYSLHLAGKLDEALPAHLKAAEFPRLAGIASYNVACVHALKSRTDDAFAWLDKAVAAGFSDVDQLRGDSDFASMRTDPRFGKLEAALAGKAKDGATQTQVFAQSVDRKNARAAWFSRSGSPGQISIDYSPVPWADKYETLITSGKNQGKKWRLGADFWTRLDTSMDLQCGDVKVPAGYYYLTLEQRSPDNYVLAMHAAAAVRKQKLDASQAERLQGGIEVALAHKQGDEIAKSLEIAVEMQDGSKTEGSLRVRFGGHVLSAPFVVKFD